MKAITVGTKSHKGNSELAPEIDTFGDVIRVSKIYQREVFELNCAECERLLDLAIKMPKHDPNLRARISRLVAAVFRTKGAVPQATKYPRLWGLLDAITKPTAPTPLASSATKEERRCRGTLDELMN
jgi:hypothetical protein